MSAEPARRDWETTLQAWIKPASDTEDTKRKNTEREISEAIRASAIPASSVRVYAKGSYANNTNVRADSDVDVAVEFTDVFYYEITHKVEGYSPQQLNISTPATGPFSGPPVQFKDAVEQALVAQFGRAAVTRANKALTVRESTRSLAADVVPCFSWRRYFALDPWSNAPQFHEGTAIHPDRGGMIENWPQQHYDNGVAKNNRTSRRYKRMVRALKRLENEMVKARVIAEIPSYLTECLVYNVPDENFGHTTYLADLCAVLAVIYNETMTGGGASDWLEVNGLKWLFGDDQKWNRWQANAFAGRAWEYLGFE
jgi:predicted nucleotidyltransferase